MPDHDANQGHGEVITQVLFGHFLDLLPREMLEVIEPDRWVDHLDRFILIIARDFGQRL